MPRYFWSIFLVALFLVPTAFASRVTTVDNKTFRPNAGLVEVPQVLIADDIGMPRSLSGATTITLALNIDSNVRFPDPAPSTLSLSGASVSKVSTSGDLRSVRFDFSTPLPAGASLSVNGLKVIVYNRYSPLRGFELDVGSDGSIDAYDLNGIRVSEEYGTPDTHAPHPPLSVSGSIFASSVTVSAIPSADVDVEAFSVTLLNASGSKIFESTEANLSSKTYDFSGVDRLEIRSMDRTGNLSTPKTIYKTPPVPVVIPTASGSTDPVVPSVGSGVSTSSGTSVPAVSTGAVTATGAVVATGTTSTGVAMPSVSAYVPLYRSVALTNVIASMDNFVMAKSKNASADANVVMMVRNDVAKLLESFFKTRVSAKKKLIFGQLRTKVAELKSLFR